MISRLSTLVGALTSFVVLSNLVLLVNCSAFPQTSAVNFNLTNDPSRSPIAIICGLRQPIQSVNDIPILVALPDAMPGFLSEEQALLIGYLADQVAITPGDFTQPASIAEIGAKVSVKPPDTPPPARFRMTNHQASDCLDKLHAVVQEQPPALEMEWWVRVGTKLVMEGQIELAGGNVATSK